MLSKFLEMTHARLKRIQNIHKNDFIQHGGTYTHYYYNRIHVLFLSLLYTQARHGPTKHGKNCDALQRWLHSVLLIKLHTYTERAVVTQWDTILRNRPLFEYAPQKCGGG